MVGLAGTTKLSDPVDGIGLGEGPTTTDGGGEQAASIITTTSPTQDLKRSPSHVESSSYRRAVSRAFDGPPVCQHDVVIVKLKTIATWMTVGASPASLGLSVPSRDRLYSPSSTSQRGETECT
jgi:hypothetical protein